MAQSSSVQDAAQALAAAESLLRLRLKMTRALKLTAAPNPALEAGDTIEVVFPDGREERHQIDAVTIDLAGGAQEIITRSNFDARGPARRSAARGPSSAPPPGARSPAPGAGVSTARHQGAAGRCCARRCETDPSQARLLIATTGAALADPEANAYVNIVVEGATTKIPKLAGAPAPAARPPTCWRSGDFLLYLGTVSYAELGGGGEPGPAGPRAVGPAGPEGPEGDPGATGATGAAGRRPARTGPTGPARPHQGTPGPTGPSGAGTFLSGTGAPTAGVGADGAVYLDRTSGRFWGPKAAGAWPGTAFGRIVPLAPTWAQLKTG